MSLKLAGFVEFVFSFLNGPNSVANFVKNFVFVLRFVVGAGIQDGVNCQKPLEFRFKLHSASVVNPLRVVQVYLGLVSLCLPEFAPRSAGKKPVLEHDFKDDHVQIFSSAEEICDAFLFKANPLLVAFACPSSSFEF